MARFIRHFILVTLLIIFSINSYSQNNNPYSQDFMIQNAHNNSCHQQTHMFEDLQLQQTIDEIYHRQIVSFYDNLKNWDELKEYFKKHNNNSWPLKNEFQSTIQFSSDFFGIPAALLACTVFHESISQISTSKVTTYKHPNVASSKTN